METNNKNFKHIKILFVIELSLIISLFLCEFYSRKEYTYLLLVCLFMMSFISFYHFYNILKKIYEDIRKIIYSVDKRLPGVVLDGDIGLLYERIMTLEKRNIAYEDVIKQEKENLKKTIEDITHQMKTPLSSISLNNELLLEMYDNEKLKVNQHQIDKLNHLIKSLLTISKLENNAINFDFQKLPVHYLLDLSLQNINSLIGNKKVIIKDVEGEFFYDESWMVEAISNIIKNCLEQKYVTEVSISSEMTPHYLKIYIKDNGKGFSPEDLKHLFDRFYKGDNSHKDSIGIGMSLVKEIVKSHHGYIDIYNEIGACFELTFPRLSVREKQDY